MPNGELLMPYRDRAHAGRILAEKIYALDLPEAVVCAIPNGGVPAAVPIAEALEAPLRLFLVRKLQFPENPEAGFGAVTSDGVVRLNEDLMRAFGISAAVVEHQKERALASLRIRAKRFGPSWTEFPPLEGVSIVLVDDGLASGLTMEAAVVSLRSRKPVQVVVAVPTASMQAVRRLEALADRVVCPHIGRLRRFAVADAYSEWNDLGEDEVMTVLENFNRARGGAP